MDREDIIRMAQEAISLKMEDHVWTMSTTHLERFAALVTKPWADQLEVERKKFQELNDVAAIGMQHARADEREACAKLAEEPYEFTSNESHRIAAAIRAMGNT